MKRYTVFVLFPQVETDVGHIFIYYTCTEACRVRTPFAPGKREEI